MMLSQTPVQTLLKPMMIRDIAIDLPLMLAPMAGYTHHAFRTLCRELGGCGLVYTEFISTNLMKHSGLKRVTPMFDWTEDERPLSVQLYGNVPEVMAEGAQMVVERGAEIVDINMGCWVPKVANKGSGAGLLRDIDLATRVVETVVNAVSVPVTVKVRSGWEPGKTVAIDFAKAAEQVGAQAIAVHARYAKQGFQGEADWDIIRQVKEAVTSIPVIGNGDVTCTADAARMLALTGCDGVMIGRAAMGKPWIFQHIAHELQTGEALPELTRAERAAVALRHARSTFEVERRAPHRIAWEMRGQLQHYGLDEPGSKAIRNQIVHVESLADIEHILLSLIETDSARVEQ
jgi:tRNA-dihydrouridine synthase B